MLRHASSLSTPLRCRAEPPDEGCGARTMPNDENVDKNWEGFSEVQELTKKNENLIRALDDANRQVAELSARFETGGPGPAADARESKIVEVSKKNRALTLSVERERAEKLRALAQLKSAQVRLDTLDSERTESEVERACREVVEEASKATEAAQNELAAMREKWKQASARAERLGGQNAFIKTENDRLKVIIRREVGEHVDFGRLDDEIAATGGKRGRALTIRDLNMKIGLLRVQLAEANDALAAVAAAPETMELPTVGGEETNPPQRVDEPSHSGPVAGSDQDQDQDVHHHAEEDGAQKEEERSDLREASRAAAAASARLDAQARRLEATSLELERLRDALATEKEDATLLAKMNRNLETEVRSLLEKVVVLKDKSDHDDRLVDALRDETARLRAAAEDDAISEVSEHRSRFEPPVSGGDKNAVPLAEYRSMEARASSLEAKLRKQEQITLHARAKNASLEQALERATRSDVLSPDDEAFSPAAIAAAAAGAGAGADARRDEDIANLIEHSEALERVCQEMKGKLVVAEKQVAQLREQVQAERRKYQDATRRLDNAGDAGLGEGGNAAALRAALAEAEAETQRVRSKYEGKLEEMEREVELYAEMMTEMKRAASANASRGGSPAPMRRKGLPG